MERIIVAEWGDEYERYRLVGEVDKKFIEQGKDITRGDTILQERTILEIMTKDAMGKYKWDNITEEWEKAIRKLCSSLIIKQYESKIPFPKEDKETPSWDWTFKFE